MIGVESVRGKCGVCLFQLCADAAIAPLLTTPAQVEAVHRVKDGKTYLFLLNHNETAQQVDVPDCYRTWDGADWMGTIGPMGVQVFVKE